MMLTLPGIHIENWPDCQSLEPITAEVVLPASPGRVFARTVVPPGLCPLTGSRVDPPGFQGILQSLRGNLNFRTDRTIDDCRIAVGRGAACSKALFVSSGLPPQRKIPALSILRNSQNPGRTHLRQVSGPDTRFNRDLLRPAQCASA